MTHRAIIVGGERKGYYRAVSDPLRNYYLLSPQVPLLDFFGLPPNFPHRLLSSDV
jgi:hypothetical protein